MDSDTGGVRGAGGRPASDGMPRWVKIFGIVAGVAVAGFAALHHAGGGMEHMTHGDIGARITTVLSGRPAP